MYMQLGFGAFEDIIHVSAHPVAPSSGMTASIGFLSACSTLTWYGHAVPTARSPDAKPSISSEYAAQYRPTMDDCCLSSSTAASSCSVVSSYGSVIPRSGLCAFKYRAASAMKIGLSYAVIFPAYGESASQVMSHEVGVSVTTSVLYISTFGPHR